MSKKLLLIIVAAVVVLAGAGAGSYFMFFRSPPAEGEEAPKETSGPAGLLSMDPFLVNINDPEGERYAKVQVQLTVVPDSAVDEISADSLLMAQMRDRVLTLLSAKSFQELSSPIGKEGFRREIRARLNPLLEEGEIQEVLFQDFLVQ